MSNHHFHQSAGPIIILLFYYFISTRFQAEDFASRVAKPACRTTIFTGRPDRLLFYYLTNVIRFQAEVFFASFTNFIRFQAEVLASRVAKPEYRTTIFTVRPAAFASRVAKPECRTTIFTGRPDRLLFYYFTNFIRLQAEVFASRVAKPDCRTPDRLLFYKFHSVPGRGFCISGRET